MPKNYRLENKGFKTGMGMVFQGSALLIHDVRHVLFPWMFTKQSNQEMQIG